MIEIQPVSSSYPVKKTNKTIRDPKYQLKKKETTEDQLEDEENTQSNERPEQQHIDEIV